MRYFMPETLTFWTGVILIAVGSLALFGVGDPEKVGVLSEIVAALVGSNDASPIGLIGLGAGLIGIRRALRGALDV